MSIDDIMEKAAIGRLRVEIVDVDGITYKGTAEAYTQADDEEDGFSTICIDSDRGAWCLGENEIRSIKIV